MPKPDDVGSPHGQPSTKTRRQAEKIVRQRERAAQRGRVVDVPTVDEVQALVEQIDEGEVRLAQQSRVTVEIWDASSPIGDLQAPDVLERFPGMEAAYIIAVDGNPVVFQPYVPGQEGNQSMNEAQAQEYGEDHAEQVLASLVGAEIRKLVSGG